MTSPISRFRRKWIRLTNWEFWPFSVVYFPVFFYYVWLALRSRSFFFFTSSNPSIEFGGMMGERKSQIFDLIPSDYIPAHVLIPAQNTKKALAAAERIGYPLIAKPDIGERGLWVEKIKNQEELINYAAHCPVDFLIQEFIGFPIELGLFYIKYPGEKHGRITSIAQKDFLHVEGDGYCSVRDLLHQNPRAMLQVNFDHPRFQDVLMLVPTKGEKVLVEGIGNHCRGTIFLDKTLEADDRLHAAIDQLAEKIDGFYFGRFDLRCASFEDLRTLKNFKILELNGAGAEPGHIYQPGYPLLQGYRSILWHLQVLQQISASNQQRGNRYWTFQQGLTKIRQVKAYKRRLRTNV